MQGTMLIIPVEGEITTTKLVEPLPVEALQGYVGGWLELLPRWSMYAGQPAVAFCNEEGKQLNLPFNHRATEMWKAQFSHAVDLRGAVVVLSGDKPFMDAL